MWIQLEHMKEFRAKVRFPKIFLGVVIGILAVVVQFFATDALHHARFAFSQSTATTTVTILNTPPLWTNFPYELTPSNTSTPTNAGLSITWTAIGTDPNSDNYYFVQSASLCRQ